MNSRFNKTEKASRKGSAQSIDPSTNQNNQQNLSFLSGFLKDRLKARREEKS
jgi:hypothetical protein